MVKKRDEEMPEAFYFDLCGICGALWKSDGVGVLIQSAVSVRCLVCQAVAIVAPLYTKFLRRIGA